MANSYYYSNTAQATTLAASVTAGATSMTMDATVGFPTSYPYILAVGFEASDEELVKVTAAAGAVLTVERGFGGTSAQSHSLGAVVKHVVNAQDLTDFRTHEAASAAVHGLSGTVVGTTDTQTLSGKTLTSPTINSGALSGTFTGAPTLSGAVTFSGTPVFSAGASLAGTFTGTPTLSGAAVFTGTPVFQGASASAVASSHRVSGDSVARLQTQADGKLLWGSGSGAADVVLYREAADVLATDDTVRVYRASALEDAFQARVAGDTVSRLNIDADGTMSWGPGGASAQDTNLYRTAANTLTTDDHFVASGTITGAVETTSSGFTIASGFSLNSFNGRRTCGVATVVVYVQVTSTISTTSSTSTNIVDKTCGTLPSGWRPALTSNAVWSNGLTTGECLINTDGTIDLRTTGYNQSIDSGSNVRITATYVL